MIFLSPLLLYFFNYLFIPLSSTMGMTTDEEDEDEDEPLYLNLRLIQVGFYDNDTRGMNSIA